MREAVHFTFDNISSEDMGVHIISLGEGLFQESFLPRRSIVEQRVANQNKPYHTRVDIEPLAFTLRVFISEWRERNNLRQIARWLFQPYYKPLTFDTKPGFILYAMVEGDSTLTHNGAKDGYFDINIRCNSPFMYSPATTTDIVQSRTSTTNHYSIYNEGDFVIKPKVWITKKIANGSISIINDTTDQTTTLTNLQFNEEIFIDFENEEIISSLENVNVYRYANHNNVWLEFQLDSNSLRFIGDFDIYFEYEFVYLAE
ncbi:phage tail domain-containing protein [Solibacillus sp. FSL H8-0523]|uniref:phage tail domain-containing protein n=1 Tax=Solibacillus sp. FSL H8-0523 TaxID=2954511 RepID=UPI0031012E2D